MVESPTIAVGSRIADRYEILTLTGQGGMGTVFRARDLQTGAEVAVKVLAQPHIQPADRERFLREASILAALRHPGIVSHVDHGFCAPGVPFLVMEWLLGEDLARYLSHTRLKLAQSVELARRIAEGLAAAHDQGVVHRDLKPSALQTERAGPLIDPQRRGVLESTDGGFALGAADRKPFTRRRPAGRPRRWPRR
jgi:serine/threonine protein kinase